MKPSLEKVLIMLRKKRRSGITTRDFTAGKEIRKRLSELRQLGYKLTDSWENHTGGKHKRYWLLSEPK